MMSRFIFFVFFVTTLLIGKELEAETKLLRYPNTSDTEITFINGGDVFSVALEGGLARRLTSSDGYEMYPRYSPDGRHIAFSAEYDGNREIYIIPSQGGIPKRLTWGVDFKDLPERMGPDKIIMQWSNDGNILYRGRQHSWNVLVGDLFLVDTLGTMPQELPLPRGGFASLAPDGNKIAYNRIFREYRTWKRYSGGQADDIWIYDFKTKESQNITNNDAQDIIPMWAGSKVYFLSDRDFTMNLFSYDLNTKVTKKITNFTDFDVKFPSLGSQHIAFENGGEIYLMDLATESVNKVPITVAADFPTARSSYVEVRDNIAGMDISSDGNRALFVARGELFTVPKETGNTRNLSQSSGVHERNAVWSPDGKWIAFISDETGEDEIYLIKPDGSDKMQLTKDANSYRYELLWSPDSRKLIASDKSMSLYFVDIATRKSTEITKSGKWEFRRGDYAWSPDSKWIAYAETNEVDMKTIKLYSLDEKNSYPVTDSFFSSSNPVFAPGGKYLFFTSDRTFRAEQGAFEYNFVYKDMTSIFGVTLQDTTINPFAKYKSDEAGIEIKPRKIDPLDDTEIRINTKNIMDRVFELPVEAANYYGLRPTSKHRIYYVRSKENQKAKLYYYDFIAKEEKEFAEISSYIISPDESHILYRKDKDYFIEKFDESLDGKKPIDLSQLEVKLDRHAEWRQIFNETWRQFKYFFYDPGMHGYDWLAIKKRYEPLVDYVMHRHDLTYILGEMIGELDVGHAYVAGGDAPEVKEIAIGLLGAEFELDKSSGAYKITKILKGRNWEEKTRSPLTEPGIRVSEGDYLLAIDGEKLTKVKHPFTQLENKANKFVTLTVNSSPSMSGAREITVKTISRENELRYFNWVENNRRFVDSVTNGRIGYIHIPDMGFDNGLNEFAKYFYPQLRKEGLVIDDRYNGGGNVSSLIIERLRRELAVAKSARNQTVIGTTPNAVHTGPIVLLINQQSMSDGDLFPFQFNQLGLGPIIGKRTWGGVIGIRGSLPLLDGSQVHRPEFANFGRDGSWILEDVGMKPDIEVENDPAKEYQGIDQQLIRGIEEVERLIKTNPKPQIPQSPIFPDKNPFDDK